MNDEINFKNDQNAHIKLSKAIQRYSFVIQRGNVFDICDWFPFFLEYNIFLDTETENVLIEKAVKHNNPIIWANILLYSQYYDPFFNEMKDKVSSIVEKQISRISDKEPLLQTEIWYVLIFHNCPYLSSVLRNAMSDLINQISKTASKKIVEERQISQIATKLVCDFLQIQSHQGNKPVISLFNWKGKDSFSEQITYRTYQRTIFKRYRKNQYGLYASLD